MDYEAETIECADKEYGKPKRDEGLENVLSAFQDAFSWPQRETFFPSSASIVSLNALFCLATAEMSRLAADNKCNEADEIVNVVLELVHVWGENVFQSLKMRFFSREEICVGRFLIKVGQYLRPEPLQENCDEGGEKLYCFIAYDTELEKYICTYHLEYRHYGEIRGFYILKLKSRRGKVQIAAYGESCPTYWRIRLDVLRDFSGRKRSLTI